MPSMHFSLQSEMTTDLWINWMLCLWCSDDDNWLQLQKTSRSDILKFVQSGGDINGMNESFDLGPFPPYDRWRQRAVDIPYLPTAVVSQQPVLGHPSWPCTVGFAWALWSFYSCAWLGQYLSPTWTQQLPYLAEQWRREAVLILCRVSIWDHLHGEHMLVYPRTM